MVTRSFCNFVLTLSCSTSVINIPNSEHIHASDKYILSFISVRSFAEQERVNLISRNTDAAKFSTFLLVFERLIRFLFQILCFHWSYFYTFLLCFSTCFLLFVGMTRCRFQHFHLLRSPNPREKLHIKDLYIHIQKKIFQWR